MRHTDSKIGDSCVIRLVELLKQHCPYYYKKEDIEH